MDQQKKIKIQKQNMKVYSIYRAISLDLIFFYAIEVLFLSQVKHIDVSDIVFAKSFYAIFMVILQIPISILVDRIGTKKCTILGNLFNCIFVLLIILCNNLKMLIFAQFISSICFALKDISDNALLHYSIPSSKHEGEIFSRLEGRAFKDYYIIDAVTSIISGFLYVVNPYIPLIGSFIFAILATVVSFAFEETEKDRQREKQSTKKYFEELVEGVKFIINSQRLRSLFLYSGIAWGIFCLMSTYRTSILMDIKMSEQFITIVAAIVGIAASIGSKIQLQFHNKYRNKALTVILYALTFSIWIAGIAGSVKIPYLISVTVLIISFVIINALQGIHIVLSSRYLGNFANEKILTQISAVNAISRNSFRAVIGFIGAYLLKITDTANSMILVAIILLVTVLGLTSYMKVRLGLKPEEYGKNEIYTE